MSNRAWAWPLTILASAAVTGAMSFLAPGNPGRLIVGFWFLLVCPGMSVIRLFGIEDRVTLWTLAAALSLALDTIVAGAMLYAGMWSPQATLLTLIGICVVGAGIQIAGAIRSEQAGRSAGAAPAGASLPAVRRWSPRRLAARVARRASAAQMGASLVADGDRASDMAMSTPAAPAESAPSGVASGVPFA